MHGQRLRCILRLSQNVVKVKTFEMRRRIFVPRIGPLTKRLGRYRKAAAVYRHDGSERGERQTALFGRAKACELLWSRLWNPALRFPSAPRSVPAVLLCGIFNDQLASSHLATSSMARQALGRRFRLAR